MTSERVVEQPPKLTHKRRRWLWVLVGVLATTLLSAGGYALWVSNPAPPMAQGAGRAPGRQQGRRSGRQVDHLSTAGRS
jgi:hypothetical protein